MDLHLQDSQSGQKRRFEPADPARVTLYVCGPTVYNLVHIGNGRPAVVFDVLFRLLRALYPNVVYARNITDIDDKINAAARSGSESIATLTERFTAAYREDVNGLGVLPPTVEPCATGHIEEMVAMISTLIEKGHAYAADGHVLFHVPSDPDYGSLSHRTLEDMLDGARVDVAPYKRDPKDFVLWKPSTPDLPGWESPWGRGRPGWHIECSAMILKHLGTSIDIHGGGSDLAFPHHENEAAQSRCANDTHTCVRYWLHNGMLTLGAEKMSKSVGNIVTIRALRANWSGEVLRYALLSGHYRSQLVWSDDLLQQSATSLDRLYQAVRVAGADATTAVAFADQRAHAFPVGVLDALCDDLNTPLALAALHQLASEIHRTTDTTLRAQLRAALLAGGWLLGLLTESADAH
ncbi:MAG TPA: cysteine--tRNA ligase, partial [Gammaproteobacteria bacterium]|nr:cysteine--tRNA ligase [Gammaproteobacteria bacterium]